VFYSEDYCFLGLSLEFSILFIRLRALLRGLFLELEGAKIYKPKDLSLSTISGDYYI
jgi:hypothetical protein